MAKAVAKVKDKILELILQRIKLRCRRRILWLRKIWEEAMNDHDNKPFDNHIDVDGLLALSDLPSDENAWYNGEPTLKELNHEIQIVDDKILKDKKSRFSALASIFKLNEAEQNILQTCLALYLEPNLGRVYAYIQDHSQRSYVTRHLTARLFQNDEILSIGSGSALFRWDIISESETGKSEPSRLECDLFVRNWLLGSEDIDESISDFVAFIPYNKPLSNWPVKETAESISELLNRGEFVRLLVTGDEGSGRSSFASAICKKMNLPLLSVNGDGINHQSWPKLFLRAQRQALLGKCALLWEGRIPKENHWPAIPVFALQFVTGEKNESILPDDRLSEMRVEMPAIRSEELFALWQKLIPASVTWPKEDLMQMVRGQNISIGMLSALSKMQIRNVDEASEKLRNTSRQQLGSLAQLINASFSTDDLILPEFLKNVLDDLNFEATERAAVWEDATMKKYFPQGRGLIALFTGAPGTGKTMAAQVMANNLQLDLFRIDLSAVVSKYIGETSKNIDQILSRAANMNAILLFDEADALFGKRTEIKDAHDRYANTDTNYLLQAIEQFSGIVILASNKKENIDHGFRRRLRYSLEFPKPDAKHRLQLWQKLLSELTGKKNADALRTDIERLSELLDVTGAQIKQSILSAIFMARREKKNVSFNHLVKGIERELLKENRSIGRQVLEMVK